MKGIKTYLLILMLLLEGIYSATAQDQDEISILFIGNSFTARHDLKQLVKKVLEEGKPELDVNVAQIIYGGQSLFQHTEYYFSQSFIEQSSIDDTTIHERIKKMEELLELDELPQEFVHFWKDIRKRTTVPGFPKNLI